MLQINCPQCRSILAFPEEFACRLVRCPDCNGPVRVGESADVDGIDSALVLLSGTPAWELTGVSFPIFVDGREVGVGSVKKGFEAVIKVAAGQHVLEIGPSRHTINLRKSGRYEITFEYSRARGKFSTPPNIYRLRADDSVDWPTGNEPIDLTVPEHGIPKLDQAVLDELSRMQTQKTGWGTAIALVVISALVFVGSAKFMSLWESIALLIPILLFHELGHYVAMLAFGYRNVRMFFIPFFGAAVSGRHYNVAGWKKVIVSLAGPVPGIVVGSILGLIEVPLENNALSQVARLLVGLNGFNLLPVLPLDGGWIVHAILFARSPVLDLIFRLIAALALFAAAIFSLDFCLGSLGLFLVVTAPMAFRTGRVVHRLGEEGLMTKSDDGNSIPAEAALHILRELRKGLPSATPPKVLAQNVADIFERFNAEPPSLPVSMVLLFVYGVSFLAALGMVVLLPMLRLRMF